MDKYLFPQEIGRGKGSIVYKGRKKHTIQYVAVKKVDKALQQKVLNEVCSSMLHKLYFSESTLTCHLSRFASSTTWITPTF
jgi:hypothetical protein